MTATPPPVRRSGAMAPDDLSILTGAPGSGKTAILDLLEPTVRCVREPARAIILEQRAIGGAGTSDRDPSLFVELLLQRSIEKHEGALQEGGLVVFDRGVPDCIAYAVQLGVDPAPSVRASEVHRYRREVLLLEPWEDIYVTDDERTMSFADTLGFHAAIVDAYEGAGYVLVQVPQVSVEDRASFVLASLSVP
jgi:predicted ATPase